MDVVKDKSGRPTFMVKAVAVITCLRFVDTCIQNRQHYSELQENQIRAFNKAEQPVALTVGT